MMTVMMMRRRRKSRLLKSSWCRIVVGKEQLSKKLSQSLDPSSPTLEICVDPVTKRGFLFLKDGLFVLYGNEQNVIADVAKQYENSTN